MAFGLSTFTDAFTGQPGIDAANQTRAMLAATQGNINDIYSGARTGGLGALTSALPIGANAITGGTAQGRTDISGAIDPAIAALYGGQNLGANALMAGQGGGLAALYGGVGGATGAYTPLGLAGSQALAGGNAYSTM